jgi:hypothetical protein
MCKACIETYLMTTNYFVDFHDRVRHLSHIEDVEPKFSRLFEISFAVVSGAFISQRQTYVTTDRQSASLSWNKAPIWGLRPVLYYCQTVAVVFMRGARSDERTGLSFAKVGSNKSVVSMYNLHFTCY